MVKFVLDIIKFDVNDVVTASNEGGSGGGMGEVCLLPEIEPNVAA